MLQRMWWHAGAHVDWAHPQGNRRHYLSFLQAEGWLQVQWTQDGDAMAQQQRLWPQNQEIPYEVGTSHMKLSAV